MIQDLSAEPYPMFVKRLLSDEGDLRGKLAHTAIGLSTEVGEINDTIKKHLYYGRQIDGDNLVEEAGDILFYLQGMINTVNEMGGTAITLQSCIDANMAKLNKRYPNKGFTKEDAIARADKAGGQ